MSAHTHTVAFYEVLELRSTRSESLIELGLHVIIKMMGNTILFLTPPSYGLKDTAIHITINLAFAVSVPASPFLQMPQESRAWSNLSSAKPLRRRWTNATAHNSGGNEGPRGALAYHHLRS